jgi:beta-1,4-mannosyltransferase
VLVSLSRALERQLSRCAHQHICVSRAMKTWLKIHFQVDANVFYDRPSAIFQPVEGSLSVADRHALLTRLGFSPASLFPHLQPVSVCKPSIEQTIQTIYNNETGETTLDQSPSTAMLISATSWTPDEDFELLINALVLLEQSLVAKFDDSNLSSVSTSIGQFDRLLCVITGKGSLRSVFEARVAELMLAGRLGRRVAVRTAWLAVEDYPLLLRCANLGLSLHTSTSGLDLPMKVLDFFGSGVPVCAIDFPTISELVQHNYNGLVFQGKDKLCDQLLCLLFSTPECKNTPTLLDLRSHALEVSHWEEHWQFVMQPLVKKLLITQS